jgi:hypothetical protein
MNKAGGILEAVQLVRPLKPSYFAIQELVLYLEIKHQQ